MKYIILLQLLFVQDVFNNKHILSKFRQHGYKIKDFRMELPSYNEKYYNSFQLKTFKYNRTTPAVNLTFNMKITVQDKVEVVTQAYKFVSNEYRRFPIRFPVTLKSGFDENVMGMHEAINCGNITNMYFEKDVTYHACNFGIDETKFPPLIPNGNFRINLNLTYLNEEVCLFYVFVEIYTPIVYPPK